MLRLPVLLLVVLLLVPILWAAEFPEVLRGRQVVFVDRSENWHTAYEKCRAKGMQLLTLNTKEEFDDMVTLAKKHGPMPGFWIAATDLGHEGQFIYATNGQPVLESWGPGEPDNGVNQQVCGAWGSVTREEGYAGETRTTSHTNIDYNFKTVLLTIRYFLRVLLINTFGFEPFANKILINKHGE